MAEVPGETKQPLTFRVRPAALRRLRHRAQETGVTQTALAERYLEEGLRRDVHPLIYFRDGSGGRRAALVGTRLDVWQVMDTVRNAAGSAAQASEYLQLPLVKVEACLRYYADYPEECDEWARRVAALRDREEELARRRDEALG